MMSIPVFSSEASIVSSFGISLCLMARSSKIHAANAGQSGNWKAIKNHASCF
jgi:hypothetical protein